MEELNSEAIEAIIKIGETIASSVKRFSLGDLATFFGISGYSLRDLKGLANLKKLQAIFNRYFPDGFSDEKQFEILSDSLIELEEFIKTNSNFDDKVFEKIVKVLINGLNRKDLLTREYIKILKRLSWIDLEILLISRTLEVSREEQSISINDFYCGYLVEEVQNKIPEYPYEIIQISLEKLVKEKLLSERGKETKREELKEVIPEHSPFLHNSALLRMQEVACKLKENAYADKYIVTYSFERDLGKAIIELIKD